MKAALDKRVTQLAELLGEDIQDLKGFQKWLIEDRGTGETTFLHHLEALVNLGKWAKKPLAQLSREDLISFKTYCREHYQAPEQQFFGPRLYLKYRAQKDDYEKLSDRSSLPEIALPLKLHNRKQNGANNRIRELPVLSEAEVLTIIETAEKNDFAGRDLAEVNGPAFAVLYDSAFRKSELASMRTRDLYCEDGHWFAYCPKSKTVPRKVELTWQPCIERIELYTNARKDKDPDSPLWVNIHGERIRDFDGRLRATVQDCPEPIRQKFERAGSMCHLFRHSRATALAPIFGDPWKLADFCGWANLTMAMHYVHKGYEPKPLEKKEGRQCPGCGLSSVMHHNFCPNCGTNLSGKSPDQNTGMLKMIQDLQAQVKNLQEWQEEEYGPDDSEEEK